MIYNQGELVFGTKSMSHHLLSLIHTNKLYFSVYILISVKYLEKQWFSRPDETKKEDFKTSTLMGPRKKSQGLAALASVGAGLIIEQRLKACDSHKTKIKVRPEKTEQKRVGGKSGE